MFLPFFYLKLLSKKGFKGIINYVCFKSGVLCILGI